MFEKMNCFLNYSIFLKNRRYFLFYIFIYIYTYLEEGVYFQ